MRIGRRTLPLARAVGLLGLTIALTGVAAVAVSSPAGAQAPSTTDPTAACKKVRPAVVFIGTASTIADDTVTFAVTDVRSGTGTAGTTADVRYPTEFNARKLVVGTSYRVAAAQKQDHLESVVPTAQELETTACGESTRYADGARIDTGALVGVKAQGPALLKKIGLGILVALVVLILLGRVFDRRSRYAPPQ